MEGKLDGSSFDSIKDTTIGLLEAWSSTADLLGFETEAEAVEMFGAELRELMDEYHGDEQFEVLEGILAGFDEVSDLTILVNGNDIKERIANSILDMPDEEYKGQTLAKVKISSTLKFLQNGELDKQSKDQDNAINHSLRTLYGITQVNELETDRILLDIFKALVQDTVVITYNKVDIKQSVIDGIYYYRAEEIKRKRSSSES